MKTDLFQYLGSLAFFYTYGRIVIHYSPIILNYFFNESRRWQKRIEKPRILFHLVGLSFMHLMLYSHMSGENNNVLFQVISALVFILGFFFCHFSWTEKFIVSFQASTKHVNQRSTENFNFSISETQITQLYHEMTRYDLIEEKNTSLQDFKNVFLSDWTSHDSQLHLKMDGPSCREFYEYLIKTYPNNTLTLKDFFITSGVVVRPDGKRYNYNTIKNAPTRTPVSKHNEILENIFRKLS